MFLSFFPRLLHGHGRLGSEDQQIAGYISIELHAYVFRLEQQELHGRVILHIGNHTSIIRPDPSTFEFLILAHHPDEYIACEVEKGIGYLTNTMPVVTQRRIHLGHVCINLCPLLATARTDIHIIIMLQRCPGRSIIGEDLMQLSILLHLWLLSFHDALRIRHGKPLFHHIVVIWQLIDIPQLSATHLSWLCPVAV